MHRIFSEGWLTNVILYAVIYLMAEYITYKLIFKALVGSPKSYNFHELRHWSRKASFIGAVIFAPLYEEVMFTYLAYTSFLGYALPDQRGLVIIFVALFFALLHLPGDLRQQQSSYAGINVHLLLKFQAQRFFYSLTAYFIYQQTQSLWVTIIIHYFYNAIVSVYQFDLEDRRFSFQQTDSYLILIIGMNISFGVMACYFFYNYSPSLGIYLIPVLIFVLFDYLGGLVRL